MSSREDTEGVPEIPKLGGAAVPGLAFRRERAISILSEGFARNYLTVEEFERRVALAHGAATLVELDRLLDDIPAELQAISLRSGHSPERRDSGPSAPTRGRRAGLPARELSSEEQGVYGVMMSRTLRGRWLKSRAVSVRTLMSSTELDFRNVELPPEEIEIRVACVMSSLLITVPEDLPVQTEVMPVLGEVKEGRRVRAASADEAGPCLRITGVVVMSDVKIRTR